ncbi:MAG: terminase small subunit [Bacilli bacterium]
MKYKGRPPKYENPDDMQKLIVEYFNECEVEGKKPTVSGLGYALGLSRRQILEYENCIDNEKVFAGFDDSVKLGFRNSIKDAKRFIESCLEEKLINSTSTPIGLIFALKNNYGWVDKQEVVQTNKTIDVKLDD